MQLAFYAPMKPPNHPVPSGDRNIARALIAALEGVGADVTLASTLQTRDGKGSPQDQDALIQSAALEVDRVISNGNTAGWQAWVTYHNYYKAPDLIGPPICRAFGIPYLQVETTRARKRLTGPWAGFAQAAEAASDAAKVVFYFTKRDAEALCKYAVPDQEILHLRPFLARSTLPEQRQGAGPMLAVGMMRDGDKRASYDIIAQVLTGLRHTDWRLDIVGDGPARAEIEAMMAPFGPRVRFVGQLSSEALSEAYGNAALLLWPGVNEAVGMIYLEAQSAGLPVVAQDRPGMRDVLAPGEYPSPEAGAPALAEMADRLLSDAVLRDQAGLSARAYIEKYHLLGPAARTLRAGLATAGVCI